MVKHRNGSSLQTHHGPNERLYLAPMFGKLLVSGARRADVYSLEHGVSLNTVNYYKYKRMSREIEKGIYRVDQKKVFSQKTKIGHGGGFLKKKIHEGTR